MIKQHTDIISGIVIDETTYFTLQEVCYTCGIRVEVIEEMVAHGLIEPQKTQKTWQFDPHAVRRLKIALRLQNDLGVNIAGAALALDLLHELEELRSKIHILERQLLK